MSVCQLISFLFCSRYTRDTSPVYMLVTADTMLGLGGTFHIVFSLFIFCKQRFKFCQIFQYFSIPCQGWGGDVSYRLFISCIKIILKYSAYQCCMPPMADQLSSCCTVITRSCQFYSFFQPCLCCDQQEALKVRALKIH